MNVFISYSSKDKQVADYVCHALEQAGLKCWIAPRNVVPGNNYAREIIGAIKDCPVFLLIFSEWANRSGHVENEVDMAFNEEKVIIPLRISEADMSPELKYYLGKKHWVDGVDERSIQKLIANVKKLCMPAEERKQKELMEQFYETLVKMEYNPELQQELWIIKDKLDRLKLTDLLTAFIGEDWKGFDKEQTTGEQNKTPRGTFQILQNKDGKIMFMVDKYEGEADNPRVVYDGQDQLILYRNKDSIVFLRNIAEDARGPVSQADKILVVEFNEDDDVESQYYAAVRIVKSVADLLA